MLRNIIIVALFAFLGWDFYTADSGDSAVYRGVDAVMETELGQEMLGDVIDWGDDVSDDAADLADEVVEDVADLAEEVADDVEDLAEEVADDVEEWVE